MENRDMAANRHRPSPHQPGTQDQQDEDPEVGQSVDDRLVSAPEATHVQAVPAELPGSHGEPVHLFAATPQGLDDHHRVEALVCDAR